jgi:hypothetical protein
MASKKFIRKTIAFARSESGFSLVMVMGIGLIGLMGSMAISSSLFSGKRYSDQTQIQGQALHNAEMALKYAVNKISQSYMDNEQSSLSTTIPLPSSMSFTYKPENPQQVLITNNTPGYFSSTLALRNAQFNFVNPEIRQIVSRCQINGVKKQITATYAFYSPYLGTPGGIQNGGSSNSSNDIFSKGLTANASLNLDNVKLDAGFSPDWSKQLLVSNSRLSIVNGQANIPGTVSVFNPDTTKGPTLNIDENSSISGDLFYNGDTGNFIPNRDVNVLGNNKAGDGIAEVGTSSPNLNPYVPPQVPTEIAINMNGQASTQNVVKASFQASPNGVAQLPSLNSIPTTNSTPTSFQISLDGGTYITDSLSLSSNDSLSIRNMTEIYIQDTPPNLTSLELNGNLNPTAGDLRIFYNGSKPINIDLSKMTTKTFKAQIFAPNSDMSVNLANNVFEGTITANRLDMKNGAYSFMPANSAAKMPKISGNIQKLSVQRISWVESNTW